MLELAPFAKVFATGSDDPFNNRYCFYCMLCKRNILMRTRGLYELKRQFLRDCLFRADQRLKDKLCPGKVRVRDGRVLYGSKLEAERELYMELHLTDLSHKMLFIILFTMMFWKGNRLHLLRKKPVFVFRIFC